MQDILEGHSINAQAFCNKPCKCKNNIIARIKLYHYGVLLQTVDLVP